MCICIKPAKLSKTIIYAAEVEREPGDICHVIGYQNAISNNPGPNAMLLPFPAVKHSVTKDNLINGQDFPNILKDYDKAVDRLQRNNSYARRDFFLNKKSLSRSVEVFESGSYTVVLAQNAYFLKQGLAFVPINKRPSISFDFVDSLYKMYPDFPIALCCFDGSLKNPEPLFWWYKPENYNYLFAPAIDAHDGNPPNLSTIVKRDHTLIFSSFNSEQEPDAQLKEKIKAVPEKYQWLFNSKINGAKIKNKTPNGDFICPLSLARKKSYGWIDVAVRQPLSSHQTITHFI